MIFHCLFVWIIFAQAAHSDFVIINIDYGEENPTCSLLTKHLKAQFGAFNSMDQMSCYSTVTMGQSFLHDTLDVGAPVLHPEFWPWDVNLHLGSAEPHSLILYNLSFADLALTHSYTIGTDSPINEWVCNTKFDEDSRIIVQWGKKRGKGWQQWSGLVPRQAHRATTVPSFSIWENTFLSVQKAEKSLENHVLSVDLCWFIFLICLPFSPPPSLNLPFLFCALQHLDLSLLTYSIGY